MEKSIPNFSNKKIKEISRWTCGQTLFIEREIRVFGKKPYRHILKKSIPSGVSQ